MDKRDKPFGGQRAGNHRAVSFGNTALDNPLRGIFLEPFDAGHAHVFQNNNNIRILLGDFDHGGFGRSRSRRSRADLHVFIKFSHIFLSLP